MGELDFFVQLVARRLLASSARVNISQCRLPAQVALAPERKGLREHDGVGGEDAAIFVGLVAVADRRIIERTGPGGLRGHRFGIQCRSP